MHESMHLQGSAYVHVHACTVHVMHMNVSSSEAKARRRERHARRGGAGEAISVMTGSKLRSHTSVGKGREA
jgi:hypothetical protein